jgi:hypothetical protein
MTKYIGGRPMPSNRKPAFLAPFLLGALAATATLFLFQRASLSPAQPAEAANPLLDVNKAFRAAYAAARKDLLAGTGPVILVSGDELVLLRAEKRTEATVVPAIYHTLKTISHIPLAIYAMTAPVVDAPLDDVKRAGLQQYRQKLPAVAKCLTEYGLTETTLQRQQKLIAAAGAFLDAAIEKAKITKEERLAYVRLQTPLILENLKETARAQLDGLNRQVQTWKAEMTPAEWQSLRVVIEGSAMPRKGNLAVQYFSRLLAEPGEGVRIVYAESLFDETRALNLLGTNLLDSEIATAFFADPMRMHRDLLADAAAECLNEMKLGP